MINMKKIEIIIPLFYNDGKEIEQTKLDKVKRELLGKFGGLSISPIINGYWINEKTEYDDINKVYTVITPEDNELNSWISNYKKWLEHMLDQKEIFIVISEVDIIK